MNRVKAGDRILKFKNHQRYLTIQFTFRLRGLDVFLRLKTLLNKKGSRFSTILKVLALMAWGTCCFTF